LGHHEGRSKSLGLKCGLYLPIRLHFLLTDELQKGLKKCDVFAPQAPKKVKSRMLFLQN
jgi:hypothetical protein